MSQTFDATLLDIKVNIGMNILSNKHQCIIIISNKLPSILHFKDQSTEAKTASPRTRADR